jgi:N-acetylneuraminate synthase
MSNAFIISEIGINHNGDMNIVKKLIDGAKECGSDAVKFQKRTVDVVYTKAELDKPRESPWGTTNRQQKEGLELSQENYDEIDSYCKDKNIEWFASAWDSGSQDFLRRYNLKYNKIASAMLTNRDFVTQVAKEGKYTFVSTGMSTVDQVERVVDIFKKNSCPYELMHCNSIYPMPTEEANLKSILYLRDRFSCNVGYSGHEAGIIISCAAAAIGATSIERHITLDRSMYGSDQSASLELGGLRKMIQYIRDIELAMGSMGKFVSEKEKEVCKKLRKIDTL